MKRLRPGLSLLFLTILIIMPQVAGAVTTEFGDAPDVAKYLSFILNWLLPLLGGAAVLAVIYAGYLYITSQGNPEALGKAKDIIIGTLTGVVLLFLIRIILNQIGVK